MDPGLVQKSTFLKMIWNKKDSMAEDRFERYPKFQGLFDLVQSHEMKQAQLAKRANKLEAMLAAKLKRKGFEHELIAIAGELNESYEELLNRLDEFKGDRNTYESTLD